MTAHKAGFVNIIGAPNVGKSTLMNALVGERLSIITAKAQTTRHRIMGIVNEADYQIVFSDTPGILKPNYKLQESMMSFVRAAFSDADVLLFMIEINQKAELEEELLEKLRNAGAPLILLLNKVDNSNQDEVQEKGEAWKALVPNSEVLAISALHNFNIDQLLKRLIELLPESPPYYPKDALTDKPERFFVSEIIREKILLRYSREIPYSVEIVVESFKEEEKIIRIRAEIYVARESQKGIIIGHKGEPLKKVGTAARLEMEKFFGKKIFLELFVKVHKNWRDDDLQLKRFGYK